MEEIHRRLRLTYLSPLHLKPAQRDGCVGHHIRSMVLALMEHGSPVIPHGGVARGLAVGVLYPDQLDRTACHLFSDDGSGFHTAQG